ncbi:hypothetical protein ACT43E_20900 (plasmid) [Acinetobacter baumannii]
MIDIDEIRKEIAVKHGVLLAKDDPILASVMLHDCVLESHINSLSEHYAKYTRELAASLADQKTTIDQSKVEALDQIQKQAAVSTDLMTQRFITAITDTAQAEAAKAIEPIKKASADELARLEKAARNLAASNWPVKRLLKWAVALVGGASLLSTVFVMLVMMTGIAGKVGLSAEEKIQLQKGQQIEAVWSDLDQRTRDRLNSAMKAKAEQ